MRVSQPIQRRKASRLLPKTRAMKVIKNRYASQVLQSSQVAVSQSPRPLQGSVSVGPQDGQIQKLSLDHAAVWERLDGLLQDLLSPVIVSGVHQVPRGPLESVQLVLALPDQLSGEVAQSELVVLLGS